MTIQMLNEAKLPPKSRRHCDKCEQETTFSYDKTIGHSICTDCGFRHIVLPQKETKLVVAMLAGNAEKTIDLCIKSIKDVADKIIIVYDTTSKDRTYLRVEYWSQHPKYGDKFVVLNRPYEHRFDAKYANSDARNFYLDYLKKEYHGDWALILDCDEFCDENIIHLKEIIEKLEEPKMVMSQMCDIRMIHFINDFGHEDATVEKHYVNNRLFKIDDHLKYPNGEHPILSSDRQIMCYKLDSPIIYHLAYAKEMFYILDRIKTHKAKSEIHNKNFLEWWYHAHLLGEYPRKELSWENLPKLLKEEFEINEDYLYFRNRKNLETKHFLDAAHWRQFFTPKNVLVVGDGLGMRTLACRVLGMDARGFDISEYAVKNNVGNLPEEIYWQQDLLTLEPRNSQYDFIVIYDVLEHLDEKDLSAALLTLLDCGQKFVFSIPFEGDPNLYADKTHKIFRSKEWWIEKLLKAGFKLIEVPGNFLYRDQLLIAIK